MSDWRVVYKSAIEPDGSLLFPERLSKEFLDNARRTMGSYLFANQYLNEILPDEEKNFKAHWIKYYKILPSDSYRFAFIDPAIGQEKHHDYTGIVVIEVDPIGDWYVLLARRERLTPTEIVSKLFELQKQFQCQAIGVEIVAYQKALLYFLDQEMRRRNVILPVKGINRPNVSKETRILGLVPRFEWGRIFLCPGLVDLEDELGSFPRGKHDDLLDSLASMGEIVYTPERSRDKPVEEPHSPHDPNYERWMVQNYVQRSQNSGSDDGYGSY